MKKIVSLLVSTLVLTGVLLTGCSSEKKSDEVIGIGGIGSITGDTSAYGVAVRNGAQIAIDEINAKGGVQFELNFKDDENDPEKALEAYESLKDWGMQVLLAGGTTESCELLVDKADEDDVFTVTPSVSSPEIITGHDNAFRVCYNDEGQGKAAASYIAANALSRKIAVIYKNDDTYSSGVYEAFKTEIERLELEIVSVSTFAGAATKDFSSHLTAAYEAGAELIFMPIYYEPAAAIITQASEMEEDYYPLFFGTDGIDGVLDVQGFDSSLAEGLHLLSPIPVDFADEQTRLFVETYQASYGQRPNQFAANAYDAVYAIYEAVKATDVCAHNAASEMCAKLADAMTQISIDGITSSTPNLKWDATGEVAKEPVVVVVQNGSYVVINRARRLGY